MCLMEISRFNLVGSFSVKRPQSTGKCILRIGKRKVAYQARAVISKSCFYRPTAVPRSN